MKHSSNSVMAYTPQSKECENILTQSLFFQKGLDKRIFLMDFYKPASIFSKFFQSEKYIDIQEEALDKFQFFVKNTIQKEIPKEIILRIKPGHIVPTLIRESKFGGYDFMIVDKSGGNYKGALSAKEVNRFTSKSHCPVLTINKDYPVHNINKIVIPIDISQTTKKKLVWASVFANRFNAKIQIVSALNVNIKEKNSLALKNANKIEDMLKARDIECDVKILKAQNLPKYEVLLNYIQEENPDLVIIRTHQEYRFSGNMIGKFVSEIIHGTKAPVFTVGGITEYHPEEFK